MYDPHCIGGDLNEFIWPVNEPLVNEFSIDEFITFDDADAKAALKDELPPALRKPGSSKIVPRPLESLISK